MGRDRGRRGRVREQVRSLVVKTIGPMPKTDHGSPSSRLHGVIERDPICRRERARRCASHAGQKKEKRLSDDPSDSAPAPPARKILLVEDSFANRDMLTRRLQRRGFTVCSAEDGPTGVAMSVSEAPDVILMDVALGEMDGWQATRLIKSDLRTRGIPIIALTAHALASDREKSVEVGCADFDTKPVDLTRLLSKIERCLTRNAAGLEPFPQRSHLARQEHIEGVQ